MVYEINQKKNFYHIRSRCFFSQSYNRIGSISYKYYIMCLFDKTSLAYDSWYRIIHRVYISNDCLITPSNLYLSTYQLWTFYLDCLLPINYLSRVKPLEHTPRWECNASCSGIHPCYRVCNLFQFSVSCHLP